MRHDWAAWLCGLCLLGCESEGPAVAGTSTSVGTSIGGTAVRADGSPAAGALAIAREDAIAWVGGRPEGRLLDSARADSAGRFRLIAPATGFRLEIVCDGARSCSASPEVWQDWATPIGGVLKAARLAAPGSLAGRWVGAPGDTLPWLGIAGTARFTRPDSADGRFRLDGLAPGSHALTLLSEPATNPNNGRKAGAFQVESGKVKEIGTVR